jgi:two-component system, OmpR family, response regulator ChvI
METWLSRKGFRTVFSDKQPSPIIARGNSTSSVDQLFQDPLNPYTIQIEQNDSDKPSLTNHSENFCVNVIDIVGSTSIVSTLDTSKKITNFYGIFINSIANILKKYRAKIIKTVGDGVISYFPETIDTNNMSAFENVLECCYVQIDELSTINTKLREQGLPTIRYRVSADYGKVERARFKGFDNEDLFGSTVNVCSKINLHTPPNGIVIGNDLYRLIRSFKLLDHSYMFDEMDSYYCGAGKFSYPLYLLSRMKQTMVAPVNPLNRSMEEIKKHVFKDVKLSRIPKILLIDDKIDDLFVLENFLTLGGFEVKSFSSPREALLHYTNADPSSYDLVISDIRMPEFNGFQLYYRLKSINNDVKVLFATCLDIAEELLTVIPELKLEQVIQKPIEKEKFIEIVKKNIH